jgi:hypothetical protein
MSHTFSWEGLCWAEQRASQVEFDVADALVTFHFNGDFSGSVKLDLPNWVADVSVRHGAGPNQEGMAEVHIPFEALKALVLEYYRRQAMSLLTGAEGPELEKLVGPTMYKEMLAAYKPQFKYQAAATTDNSPETSR